MPWRLLRQLVLGVALVLALGGQSAPESRPEAAAEAQQQPRSGVLALLPADVVTEHESEIGGETLAYRARAGTLALMDASGQPSAAIFYIAYTRAGTDLETRPLTFAFNGGPGASSAYLHLGLVGPQVAAFGPQPGGVQPDGARARLRANPDSWIGFTDLVLIDPVGTGWSRAADPEEARRFWSVGADAESIAKAIALYLAHNGRTASPKYLLGESYGGYRAAKLALALQREQGIIVDGIVMVSPFLDGSLGSGQDRHALSAALLLPSIAAAELDRDDRFTPEALAAAERFALGDYLVTLAGKPPEGETAERFYAQVGALSGLPPEIVRRARGFIGDAYLEHAGAERGEAISPYDAAFAAPDPFPDWTSAHGRDPILDGYLQGLGGLFVGYARDRLGFETDMTYRVLSRQVSRSWDWPGGGRRQASAERDLRELLALNPGFRLFAAHGRSDLVTPYAVSRYLLDHLPEIGAPGRTRLVVYEGGHMFYLSPEVAAQFTADARAFYRDTGS